MVPSGTFEEALAAHLTGDDAQAERILQRAITEDPLSEKSLLLLACVTHAAHEREACFRELLLAYPENETAWLIQSSAAQNLDAPAAHGGASPPHMPRSNSTISQSQETPGRPRKSPASEQTDVAFEELKATPIRERRTRRSPWHRTPIIEPRSTERRIYPPRNPRGRKGDHPIWIKKDPEDLAFTLPPIDENELGFPELTGIFGARIYASGLHLPYGDQPVCFDPFWREDEEECQECLFFIPETCLLRNDPYFHQEIMAYLTHRRRWIATRYRH